MGSAVYLSSFIGEPGRVHVSEATYKFLKDEYDVEPGETVDGKPFYIMLRHTKSHYVN